MNKTKWESMNENEFDAMLENSVSELLSKEIVAEVTPWKKAMNQVLIGMVLTTITLNFLGLNYIFPAIGIVLSLLGLRSLRNENSWFKYCFIITVIRSIYLFSTLILNTTIYQSAAYASPIMVVLNIVNIVLVFIQLFCFSQGLRAVQLKAALPFRIGGAVALMVWYALICLLAFIQYRGLIIIFAIVLCYFLIIRSLYKLSKEIDEAGYSIQPAKIRVSSQSIVILIVIFLLIACGCGYYFGSSYPMNWQVVDSDDHLKVKDSKEKLIKLGFPEYVLNDLSVNDIVSCEGAIQIVVDVHDYPFNKGRKVIRKEVEETDNGEEELIIHDIEYDVKELRITGVAVQIPSDKEQWIIFHHFLWTTNPGFYGTESIKLWPAYHHGEGWMSAGDVSGRVLYDDRGETFVAPYYFLGNKTFTSNSIFWGDRTSTDIFATFSMQRNGQNYRGYVAYPITEMIDGYIIDSWVNYTHQQSWFQYPAKSAMDMQMANDWAHTGTFKTIQDALQFYSSAEGIERIE